MFILTPCAVLAALCRDLPVESSTVIGVMASALGMCVQSNSKWSKHFKKIMYKLHCPHNVFVTHTDWWRISWSILQISETLWSPQVTWQTSRWGAFLMHRDIQNSFHCRCTICFETASSTCNLTPMVDSLGSVWNSHCTPATKFYVVYWMWIYASTRPYTFMA
jgi:hypothetical protein